jgi:hypothetical protein
MSAGVPHVKNPTQGLEVSIKDTVPDAPINKDIPAIPNKNKVPITPKNVVPAEGLWGGVKYCASVDA